MPTSTTLTDSERLQETIRSLFDDKIVCFGTRHRGRSYEPCHGRLDCGEYRDYFNALIERGVFVTDDAMTETALQPMRKSYLVANNVLSMLDAAFMINGRAFGMVCCEETEQPRRWKPTDVQALRHRHPDRGAALEPRRPGAVANAVAAAANAARVLSGTAVGRAASASP